MMVDFRKFCHDVHQRGTWRSVAVIFFFTFSHFFVVHIESFQHVMPRKTLVSTNFALFDAPTIPQKEGASPIHWGNVRQTFPGYKTPKPKKLPSDGKIRTSSRWEEAEMVEQRLQDAVKALQETIRIHRRSAPKGTNKTLLPPKFFLPLPPVRVCNSALAAFGDGNELIRALRLYHKMQKVSSLAKRFGPNIQKMVPTPTLATYCTLMSRAIQLGKPSLAYSVWRRMRRQSGFFSNPSSQTTAMRIVPDLRAANILLNTYVKLDNFEGVQDLLNQMLSGNGKDVPLLTPSVVTCNTVLSGCKATGDLVTAMRWKETLEARGVIPDAWTYTTLIGIVGRQRSLEYGSKDPTIAFSLLEEMQARNIQPNGKTYAALIDACGRCQRSEMALKGLRLMVEQKKKLQPSKPLKETELPFEIGAWTAAIDACGKEGRVETALRLFRSLPKYGVVANTVTCSCLTDNLLKHGRAMEALEVLDHMRAHKMTPTETMFTSVITSVRHQFTKGEGDHESQSHFQRKRGVVKGESLVDEGLTLNSDEVYAKVLETLIKLSHKDYNQNSPKPEFYTFPGAASGEVHRISRLFEAMKASGVELDLACYNTMLRACANAGDVNRAQEILKIIQSSDNMKPNDITWRRMLRTARFAHRFDLALSTWEQAVKQIRQDLRDETKSQHSSRLSVPTLFMLLETFRQTSEDLEVDLRTRVYLLVMVTKLYRAILSNSDYMGMDLLDRQSVLENSGAMVLFLHAFVTLATRTDLHKYGVTVAPKKLQSFAVSIRRSDCFKRGLPQNSLKSASLVNAMEIAQEWCDREK